MNRVDIEIAKVIGVPIDPNLQVPVVVSEICNIETAEPGEEVKYYAAYDANVDDVYTADSNGVITAHKLTPNAATALTFQGLQSKLEYVLINDVMAGSNGNSPDTGVLGGKKAAISRGMDKEEVRRLMALCLAQASQEVTQASGEDLYDLIVKMVHKVEDYGDNYVLLVGSTVKEAIDVYDKVNADNFNYRVGLDEYLKKAGIKVVKVAGIFTNSTGSAQRMLAVDKLVLIARDSTIAAGKPLTFIRRKVNPEIAKMMNAESAERLVSVAQAPSIIDGTNNLLGYGVFGFEAVIECMQNKYAISWATYSG
jgi:hypothetical protein